MNATRGDAEKKVSGRVGHCDKTMLRGSGKGRQKQKEAQRAAAKNHGSHSPQAGGTHRKANEALTRLEKRKYQETGGHMLNKSSGRSVQRPKEKEDTSYGRVGGKNGGGKRQSIRRRLDKKRTIK